jgi:hypothetical protein
MNSDPARERHVDRDPSSHRAHDEERGHGDDVEHRDVAQVERVGGGQHEVTGDHGEQLQADGGSDDEAAHEQGEAHHDRRSRGYDSGRDRPVSLGRMAAVGFDVAGVVEQVGSARDEAEGDEGERHGERGFGLGEDAGGSRGGEHEDVLRPLPGPRCAHEAPHGRAAHTRGGVRAGGGVGRARRQSVLRDARLARRGGIQRVRQEERLLASGSDARTLAWRSSRLRGREVTPASRR